MMGLDRLQVHVKLETLWLNLNILTNKYEVSQSVYRVYSSDL